MSPITFKHHDTSSAKSTPTKRLAAALRAIAVGVAVLAVALLALLALPADKLRAQGPDEAHVIVQFDDDGVGRRIDFTAPISGLRALELTGLEVVTQDFGGGFIGVCSIEGVGCPASNCFCDPNNFWNYSYWDGSAWQGYLVGAASSLITDGAVEGWRWGPWGSAMSPAPLITAAVNGLEWLRPLQSAGDGGYGSGGATAETLLAVAANGYQASEWRRTALSTSLSSYFLANGANLANSGAASAGKMALGLAAGSGCWPLNATLPISYYHPGTGAYSSTNPFDSGIGPQVWGMLGTAALKQTIPPLAAQFLKAAQLPGGGWEWDVGWEADTNTTALAVQALLAAGEPATNAAIVNGLNYLAAAQNEDGGFPYSPTSPWGTESDANSTAYVVQAILAAGQNPTTGTWVAANGDPISYLLGMQLADGSFEWQPGSGSNASATRQAIPALLGRPFPLSAAGTSPCLVQYVPVILK
jgi:hypothetical protein